MSGGTYKQAFVISTVICVVLAGTLAYVIWGRVRVAPATDDANPVVAKGPGRFGATAGKNAAFLQCICIPHSGATFSAADAGNRCEDCAG